MVPANLSDSISGRLGWFSHSSLPLFTKRWWNHLRVDGADDKFTPFSHHHHHYHLCFLVVNHFSLTHSPFIGWLSVHFGQQQMIWKSEEINLLSRSQICHFLSSIIIIKWGRVCEGKWLAHIRYDLQSGSACFWPLSTHSWSFAP